MELIRRKTLLYQAGRSEKIYQVDLYQVEGDRYLVNFRYGRRGKPLKEGSKTVDPVKSQKAERLFAQLVSSKLASGYRDVSEATNIEYTAPTPPSQPSPSPQLSGSEDPRHQAILTRLTNRSDRKWPLDRAIWRSGELKIPEATPYLIPLLGTGTNLRDYSIIWALGWCGGKNAIAAVRNIAASTSQPEFLRRIAWDAWFKLSNEEERERMKAEKLAELPQELREVAANNNSERFARSLLTYLESSDYRRFSILDTIYQIDNSTVRPALLETVKTAPFAPNYFKPLRHIFKIAEYRHDGEVFGILAYRFDTEAGTFKNRRINWEWDAARRQYRRVGKRRYEQELKKERPRFAYSEQTRDYLRRRVWRTLKTLGEESDLAYIDLATETLLQYSDEQGQRPQQTVFTRYNSTTYRYDRMTIHYDRFAHLQIFNYILYENSPRYIPHFKAWQLREGHQAGAFLPDVREEAFPELWRQHPEALLKLLLASCCHPVHQFAIKGMRDCWHYWPQLTNLHLIQFLSKPYSETVQFAFERARERYTRETPQLNLVLSLANCILPEGRSQAYQWIEQKRDVFLRSGEFVVGLILSSQEETRAFIRHLLSSSLLSAETVQLLIGQIIAVLLNSDRETTDANLIREIGEVLWINFSSQLRTIGFQIILDLLQHSMAEVQAIGARILLNHQTPATELPSDLIESLLASPHESIRGIGMQIFSRLPDEILMNDRLLLLAIAVNSSQDLRVSIRPVIQRLSESDRQFGLELAIDFIDLLLEPQRHDGVHKDLVTLLREYIPGWMTEITKEEALQLLRAKSPSAKELGGLVLQENGNRFFSDFTTKELVKLANHEILAVREAAQQMFSQRLKTIGNNIEEMLEAVRLLEAKWDDSREFAFRIFRDLPAEYWSPEVTIAACDSIREDVRRFGRDLVTRYFQASNGQEYLIKFSEHPSTDMQMFATNYLQNYAAGNCDRLAELKPYFITVLSGVNRGRVAKQRIFNFLQEEAKKSETAAQIIAEILTRQSLTIAIGDKANGIQTMLQIRKTHPEIALPLQIKEVPVRGN
ncbi:MAG: WGR domain-containing protein [Cyanobacteria bacterium SBLK]|nr:WGR domain-containing protein [Cyanobacteria bacterium SBLK]